MFSHFKECIFRVSPRLGAAAAAFFAAFLLGFAFILEYFVELTPCPLCIVQRIFFFLIGLTAICFLLFPGWFTTRIAGMKITFLALLGGAVAARQVWMQWYPENIDPTRCGVSFGSFLDQVLQALGGTGNCAIVDWTFLTLSIAEWSFLSFFFFFGVGYWFFFFPSSPKSAMSTT